MLLDAVLCFTQMIFSQLFTKTPREAGSMILTTQTRTLGSQGL